MSWVLRLNDGSRRSFPLPPPVVTSYPRFCQRHLLNKTLTDYARPAFVLRAPFLSCVVVRKTPREFTCYWGRILRCRPRNNSFAYVSSRRDSFVQMLWNNLSQGPVRSFRIRSFEQGNRCPMAAETSVVRTCTTREIFCLFFIFLLLLHTTYMLRRWQQRPLKASSRRLASKRTAAIFFETLRKP